MIMVLHFLEIKHLVNCHAPLEMKQLIMVLHHLRIKQLVDSHGLLEMNSWLMIMVLHLLELKQLFNYTGLLDMKQLLNDDGSTSVRFHVSFQLMMLSCQEGL